ncbi:MAG: hypothetical protein H6611_06825 [Ignavibacteriales bacterium]|nr:hypothetical protein [Ignavibacteriota bacterium]MCB9207006.1 hypothetical protein [Ignavibacteriales bacterium]MCB9210910.1 hypothetical protein [Ignavibacteriales bacterium]
MATKKVSNSTAPHNSTGIQPEFKNTGIDEEAKKKAFAEQEAIKARDERISLFATSHNFLSKNASSVEVQLEEFYSASEDIEAAIEEKTEFLNSSGKFRITGRRGKLNGFQKTKVRNELRNLKKSLKIIKKDISRLEGSLSSSFQRDTNRIIRGNVRVSAKRNSYHNRFAGNIKTSITKVVAGLSSEELKTLKTNVAKLDFKKGDAIMMQALIQAPRHLLTKVAANSEARKLYMQHFRNELKIGK